jgi:hypothetical protein
MTENNSSHKYVLRNVKLFVETTGSLLGMKQQYVNEISHGRFCRMDKNMSTVRGASAWYFEIYSIKTLSGESVFIRSQP